MKNQRKTNSGERVAAAAAMSDAGDYKLPVNGLINRLALKAKLVGDEKQQGRR
jgi:hypothetical protein